MKKATFSGIKSILCNVLLAALLLGLPGCAAGATETENISKPAADVSETPQIAIIDSREAAASIPAEGGEEEQPALGSVEISFDYERIGSHATNQMAIWVEDADGELVNTVFVTKFASARRGYRSRDMAISHWVGAANPESMSDGQIDAISSATPSEGHLSYYWDLTDQTGNRVPDEVYTVYLEGTLFWESNVLFSAVIDTGRTEPGDLPVEMLRSEPDNSENENMIRNVRIAAIG